MDTTTGTAEGPAPEAGEVRSADGTCIGYYRVGHGPPVVLSHGAGQSSENFRALATDLSDSFTVIVPDRRGRVALASTVDAPGGSATNARPPTRS